MHGQTTLKTVATATTNVRIAITIVRQNKHADKKLHAGRGPVGKTAVAGIKDRPTNRVKAKVVAHADGPTLNLLHVGGINKNDRAKTMVALLLSVVDEPPNLETSLPVLIGEINTRSKAVLSENGKPEFAPFVAILPPTNTTNHVKFKAALVRTIQELLNLNIRSAMNSSSDVLGQFYEVFLKYGNGAKEIGIVLTPRHIARFAVEAVGVSPTDLVLDPACGTGGFLVAAFDQVRRVGTKSQLDRFKRFNLFGIEQESYVAVLAIVNMIFRGDGKHNITEGNCFTTNLQPATIGRSQSAVFATEPADPGTEPITRVLMNPPFALKGEIDKEFKFDSLVKTRFEGVPAI